MQWTDKVSVVVTTKNEGRVIRRCLESISKQTHSNFELIVVDNYSSDATIEIAREFTDQVYLVGPERSAQRNFGLLKIASGSFGIYLDADMIITPTLLANCVDEFRKNKISGLYIPEVVIGKGLFAKVRRFERSYYSGPPIDACRFFRISDFKKIDGFDEETFATGSGEDWDFDRRLRAVGVCKSLSNQGVNLVQLNLDLSKYIISQGVSVEVGYVGIYHDESDDSTAEYIRKKMYYARGFTAYINKWGKSDSEIKKQFGLFYRLIGIFISKGNLSRTLRSAHLYFLFLLLKSVTALFVRIAMVLKK